MPRGHTRSDGSSSTRIPHDHDQTSAKKADFILIVDASRASDLHRTGDANEAHGGVGSVRFSSRFRSRWDHDRDPNHTTHLRTCGTLWRVRFSSGCDLHRTARKARVRNPRSWRDRTTIAV